MFRVLLGAALVAVLMASHDDDHHHGDDDHDNDDALHADILRLIRKIEDFVHKGGNLDATNDFTTVRTLQLAAWRIRELTYQPHNEKTCSFMKYYLWKMYSIVQYINVDELEDKARHMLDDALVVAREFVEEKTTDESQPTTQPTTQQTTTAQATTGRTTTVGPTTSGFDDPKEKLLNVLEKLHISHDDIDVQENSEDAHDIKDVNLTLRNVIRKLNWLLKMYRYERRALRSIKHHLLKLWKLLNKVDYHDIGGGTKRKLWRLLSRLWRKFDDPQTTQPTGNPGTTPGTQVTAQETTTAQATTKQTTSVSPTTSGFDDSKEKLLNLLEKLYIPQDDIDVHENSEEAHDIKDVNLKLRYVIRKLNWLLKMYRYERRALRSIKHHLLKLWRLLNKVDYHDIGGGTKRKLSRLLSRLWRKFDDPQTTQPTGISGTTPGTSPPTVETSPTSDSPTSTIITTPHHHLNVAVSKYAIGCEVAGPDHCHVTTSGNQVDCRDHGNSLDPRFVTKITVIASHHGARTTGVWDSCEVNQGEGYTYIPACESRFLRDLAVTVQHECLFEHVNHMDKKSIFLDLKPDNGYDKLLCGTNYTFTGQHAEVIHNDATYRSYYDDQYYHDDGHNHYECLITTVTVHIWASCDPHVPINNAGWKYRQIHDFFQTKCPGKPCVDVPI